MGSSDSDADADSDEMPQHKVTLDAFWIDRTEVTADQYAKCVAAGKCAAPGCAGAGKGDHPVVCMTWQGAADYCAWAGRRLPTEAEWEKAARGTDGRIYPWGNEALDRAKANYGGNVGDATPVGAYPAGASPYGALDMAGNVWEWVNDWYRSDYYASSPGSNPQGPATGKDWVLRGGSWGYRDNDLRVANRSYDSNPTFQLDFVGFRCAAAPGR
jgi:eukaryotic-like serine/threonine-protein kinase